MWEKVTGNYTITENSESKEEWKKNGGLMFAVGDNIYFAIIMAWILGPLGLGVLGAMITATSILAGEIVIVAAILWFAIESFALAYFNRNVPSAGGF